MTENWLSSYQFLKDNIVKIIDSLDSNKAYDHDMVSIRMIKLCDESVCYPLEIIYKTCLETGKFPSRWKKANIVLVHKKGDKKTIKNYRPVSLLPICGKIFERIVYNMINFFESVWIQARGLLY